MINVTLMIKSYILKVDSEDLLSLIEHLFQDTHIENILIQYLSIFSDKSALKPENFIFVCQNKSTEFVLNSFRIAVLKAFKALVGFICNNIDMKRVKNNLSTSQKPKFIHQFMLSVTNSLSQNPEFTAQELNILMEDDDKRENLFLQLEILYNLMKLQSSVEDAEIIV